MKVLKHFSTVGSCIDSIYIYCYPKWRSFFSANMACIRKILKMGNDMTFLKAFLNFFPGVHLLIYRILAHLAQSNCAFWQDSNFLGFLCGYEIQKNYFSKNLKFCTHSQCSLAHMLQRYILSSHREPPFLFRNFEISAFLTGKKDLKWVEIKVWASFP